MTPQRTFSVALLFFQAIGTNFVKSALTMFLCVLHCAVHDDPGDASHNSIYTIQLVISAACETIGFYCF